MPNKIDISQTDAQLSASITTWSGSNLIGPVQSVPIYDATGTASVAQAPSDEYYLVRRNGTIQWAPIVAGGAGIMFGISTITEQYLQLTAYYEFEEISPFNLGIGTKNVDYQLVVKNDYSGISRSIDNLEIDTTLIANKIYIFRSIDNLEIDSTLVITTVNKVTNNESGSFV
jgi:hypothetical protein